MDCFVAVASRNDVESSEFKSQTVHRMDGAKRYPSRPVHTGDGFASLHPSYEEMKNYILATRVAEAPASNVTVIRRTTRNRTSGRPFSAKQQWSRPWPSDGRRHAHERLQPEKPAARRPRRNHRRNAGRNA